MDGRPRAAGAVADPSNEVFAELDAIPGDGGVIVMDGHGQVAWRFNTSGMYRARLDEGVEPVVRIFSNKD